MDVIKALSLIYILLSTADAIITTSLIRLVQHNAHTDQVEANPIVAYIIDVFGLPGMIVYKLITVMFAVALILYVHKHDDKRHSLLRRFVKPHYIAWLGIITTFGAVGLGLGYYLLYMYQMGW
jgi:hypothetical protein